MRFDRSTGRAEQSNRETDRKKRQKETITFVAYGHVLDDVELWEEGGRESSALDQVRVPPGWPALAARLVFVQEPE